MFNAAFFRYPYDEAATVAISTIKEFQNDFKEVVFHSSYFIFFIWSELYRLINHGFVKSSICWSLNKLRCIFLIA